jgi:hypothetical protein
MEIRMVAARCASGGGEDDGEDDKVTHGVPRRRAMTSVV